MENKILIWFGIFVAVVVIIFFYPKNCGSWSSWGVITEIKCECIGVAYTPPHYYDGGPYLCYGICLKNTCKNISPTSRIEKEIPFETIEKGANSYYSEKGNFVINDAEKWDGIWNNLKGCPACGKSKPPDVDFSQETVIAVFMGEKNTGGYSIEIVKIVEKIPYCPPDALCDLPVRQIIAYINETTPKPGDIVTQVLTQPYHIVKVEKRILAPNVEFQKIE